MFLLQCPKCGNKMKYSPLKSDSLIFKKKRCVYCGRAFSVSPAIVKRTIA